MLLSILQNSQLIGAAEPNFIYYFQGCFPTNMDTVQLKMQANLIFKRNIRFQYNNGIIISSKSIAKYYGLEQIWSKELAEDKIIQINKVKNTDYLNDIWYDALN